MRSNRCHLESPMAIGRNGERSRYRQSVAAEIVTTLETGPTRVSKRRCVRHARGHWFKSSRAHDRKPQQVPGVFACSSIGKASGDHGSGCQVGCQLVRLLAMSSVSVGQLEARVKLLERAVAEPGRAHRFTPSPTRTGRRYAWGTSASRRWHDYLISQSPGS